MKMVVKLAVIVAILLMVSSSAFALPICTELCYEVTSTDQYGNTETGMGHVTLCPNGTGNVLYSDGPLSLYLFGGGPSWFNTSGDPMFGGKPFFTSWIATDNMSRAGYLQPSLGGLLLTGEGVSNGTRYTMRGEQRPLANCNNNHQLP